MSAVQGGRGVGQSRGGGTRQERGNTARGGAIKVCKVEVQR